MIAAGCPVEMGHEHGILPTTVGPPPQERRDRELWVLLDLSALPLPCRHRFRTLRRGNNPHERTGNEVVHSCIVATGEKDTGSGLHSAR